MFRKILFFLVLLLTAFAVAVLFPSASKVIECSNVNKLCKTYNVNSLFKTKDLINSVDINSARGTSLHVLGVGKNNVDNLSCHRHTYKAYGRDGKTITKVRYLLAPIGIPNPTKFRAINEYSSSASCEIDRLKIQTYIRSQNREPLVFTVGSSHLRYLWYLVSALLVIIAFMVLFKGKAMSKEEEEEFARSIPQEYGQQINDSVKKIIKNVSDLDNLGSNVIRKAEQKANQFRIDIRKKDS